MKKEHIFGKRLIELRQKHNITQEELAEKFSVTRPAVGNWEKEAVPREPILSGLADFFNVSVDYLLGRTNLTIPIDTIAAHRGDDFRQKLPADKVREIDNFINYILDKYDKEKFGSD